MDTTEGKIDLVHIEDEMQRSYIDYAMSVIIGRALPDIRDGLKPVHRRILYAMHDLGISSNKSYKKSARIVGEVLGKYHPHGDTAVYDTITRMVQVFSSREPLIDGQGNFGSIDGDSAAAMRYTEVRMSRISEELLTDIEKETVDFVPNFDESLQEPVVLPANVPNLLVNGSQGIAVGMATDIPPHNLGEIIDGVVNVIDNPDVTIDELMLIIKGPDFPTGATIYGRKAIRDAYHTGRGLIQVRAKVEIENIKGTDREQIVITEIPYQVNKANLITTIANLVRDHKIEGISDLRDESDKDGLRVVVELKKGEIAQIIINQLYKHTQMQTTYGAILLAIDENRPRIFNLREMLDKFLQHRQEVVRRRTQFDLKKAKAKAHILEGLKVAIEHLDKVIKIIKSSKDADSARESLMQEFKLSDLQVRAILDMRLQRLTGLERDKIHQEYLDTIKLINQLEEILASDKKIMDIIKKEMLEIKGKYANPRRTRIVEQTTELGMEDLIAEEDMVITISHAGYIKRLPLTTYRRQHRGGRGIMGAGTKEEDFIEYVFVASTHDYILFFTDRGQIHWVKVYQIPQAGRLSRGKAIVNLLRIAPDEKVTAFIRVREFDDKHNLIMATERGITKKTNLIAYSHPRAGGIKGIRLDKGDRLISVSLTDGEKDVLLATRDGKAIRFMEKAIRTVGRVSRGVRGIRLKKGDIIIGMEVVEDESTVVVVTANGYGKRTRFSEYRSQGRGGIGVISIQTDSRNGLVEGLRTVADADELIVITAKGVIIRQPVREIRVIKRNTKGTKLIRLDKGDRVVSIAKVAVEEEENEEKEVKNKKVSKKPKTGKGAKKKKK
ncbi:MAG: DNA gyrase subunit A [bacterium]|nr:DNA gyrase subunit A [bacterium]